MTTKFVSRSGETFRILYQTDDAAQRISVDIPAKKPFRIALSGKILAESLKIPLTIRGAYATVGVQRIIRRYYVIV